MIKKRIFLTGGRGFIGRNVIEQLGSKYSFYAPEHKDLDLYDFSEVEKFFHENGKFDIVIHGAVRGGNRRIPNNAEILNLNLRMFFNIASCAKYFDKMIYFGSGAEFGKEEPIKLVKEIDFGAKVPNDDFGFYKYICAAYIENADKILNLRLFSVWGKYEDYAVRFISNAICKTLFGLPVTIRQNVYFDYLYIDDFIKILDFFITNKTQYKNYNVGRGTPIDLLSIANKIGDISGGKSKIVIDSPGLGNEYTCNNQRLLAEIGKFKFGDFEENLKELCDWYKKEKPKLSRELLLDDYFEKSKTN